MNEKKYPSVIISGLGISGLIAASLLCKEKIKVECCEPVDISKFHLDQRKNFLDLIPLRVKRENFLVFQEMPERLMTDI